MVHRGILSVCLEEYKQKHRGGEEVCLDEAQEQGDGRARSVKNEKPYTETLNIC